MKNTLNAFKTTEPVPRVAMRFMKCGWKNPEARHLQFVALEGRLGPSAVSLCVYKLLASAYEPMTITDRVSFHNRVSSKYIFQMLGSAVETGTVCTEPLGSYSRLKDKNSLM